MFEEINDPLKGIKKMRENMDRFTKLNDITRLYNPLFSEKQIDLDDEINQLRRKYNDVKKRLQSEELQKKELKVENEKLNKIQKELEIKQKISHILPRICRLAGEKLFTDNKFMEMFSDKHSHDAVVLSIDIRRSTELMLKAREPILFSKFITELSKKLSKIIIGNYGIFDKFTGDGILAFFPKFYSGEKAIVRALKAAEECHKVFSEHYSKSRDCFNVFIKDVGLGIGVDYGNVTLVNTNNELTVVGIPVVYACRMSGAKAGETLLNQPAKEELEKQYKNNLKVIESEIDIKNEGRALAYKVEFISKIELKDDFDWMKEDNSLNNENVVTEEKDDTTINDKENVENKNSKKK